MAEGSNIAWTDHTFNPWMGCFKVSQGCKHCYAETLTSGRMGLDVFGYNTAKRKRTSVANWRKPERWNYDAITAGKPLRVFCASLADVFEDAPGPNEWRKDLWDLIRRCQWLDFQILTKRPENIARMLPDDWDERGEFWPNVWLGTSIESQRVAERETHLTLVPAFVHFVSYEPALGPLTLLLQRVEWVIVGGESGSNFRKMDLDWARDMQQQCARSINPRGTAFFFKQTSAFRSEQGADALGAVYRDYPQGWDRERIAA